MTDARIMNIVWFAADRFCLFDYTRPSMLSLPVLEEEGGFEAQWSLSPYQTSHSSSRRGRRHLRRTWLLGFIS